MNIVLIILLIIYIILGFFIMKRLDKYLEKSKDKKEKTNEVYYDDKILILGSSNLAYELINLCVELKLNYQHIKTINDGYTINDNFNGYFALSNDDFENLILCNLISNVSKNKKILSISNDNKNIFLYEKSSVNLIQNFLEIKSFINEVFKNEN